MKDPRLWEEEDILILINIGAKESLSLEFKACDALAKTDKKKNEVAKDVSAFANSVGGTIIYGLIEDRNTHEAGIIDQGYDPAVISAEWLEQVINSNIQRRIDQLEIRTVSLKQTHPGRVIYVVCVPESNRAPHMANSRYYKRFNLQSVAMEEYEVREKLRREVYPSRDIVCAWRDDVFNPLIADLKRQEFSLQHEGWAWNPTSKAFGKLHLISESSSFSANQEDCFSRYPDLEAALRRHDEMLNRLNSEGERLFEELRQSSLLRDAYVRTATPEALSSLSEENPELFPDDWCTRLIAFFQRRSDEERLSWLAELSMNNNPADSSTIWAAWWDKNSERFVQLLMRPPISASRERVLEAQGQLLKVIQELVAILKMTRKELSERHGVPVEGSRQAY